MRNSIRSLLLTWSGIIGGAISLFSNISAFVELADWARFLVIQWRELSRAVWNWCAAWLMIQISEWQAAILSTAVFLLAVGIGTRLSAYQAGSERSKRASLPGFLLYDGGAFIAIMLIHVIDIKYSIPAFPPGEASILQLLAPFLWCFFFLGPVMIMAVKIAERNLDVFFQRMRFLVVGLVLLLAMNELSKLGLDTRAPKRISFEWG